MDLIYMNEKKRDIGVMKNFTLDLAFGEDENNFELSTVMENNVCKSGFYIYAEGTDYGGIIDQIKVNTSSNSLKYIGRTWHGILGSKILQPDEGQDYLTLSGDANQVLAELVQRMGLGDLFTVKDAPSGLTVRNYKMNRYIDGYKGMCKMLQSVDGKLNITFREGFATLSAKPLTDYSKNEEFDSSQISFEIKKTFKPTNHVICLGAGDLAERTVIHLYADQDGNISHTQTFFGMDEVCEVYDYSNAESDEELEEGGRELLQKSWNSDSVKIKFTNTSSVYDIGDVVGAKENVTGISIVQKIIKKIVTLKNDRATISYKVGE